MHAHIVGEAGANVGDEEQAEDEQRRRARTEAAAGRTLRRNRDRVASGGLRRADC